MSTYKVRPGALCPRESWGRKNFELGGGKGRSGGHLAGLTQGSVWPDPGF